MFYECECDIRCYETLLKFVFSSFSFSFFVVAFLCLIYHHFHFDFAFSATMLNIIEKRERFLFYHLFINIIVCADFLCLIWFDERTDITANQFKVFAGKGFCKRKKKKKRIRSSEPWWLNDSGVFLLLAKMTVTYLLKLFQLKVYHIRQLWVVAFKVRRLDSYGFAYDSCQFSVAR